MTSLSNRVIVITGASSGIGEATARSCAAEGARVVLAARSADKLNALSCQIAAIGGNALPVPTDITSVAEIERLVTTTLDAYGHVDVLINNAGFGVFDAFPEARLADLQAMMQVNLYGVVACTQALLPHMLARRQGQIVNVASLAGLLATRNYAFYNATKFALVGMSRALRLDLDGTGVRCVTICPGVVRTPFLDLVDRRKFPRVVSLVPWLEANDVVRVILRAIKTNRTGEIVVPAYAAPLIRLANLLPGVAYALLRLIK